MNILKKLLGVGVFIVALAVAVAVTKFYTRPSEPTPRQPPTVIVQTPTAPAAPNGAFSSGVATTVSVTARLITLDFDRRKSYTTLVLERDRRQPAPEKLWVWTYFFTPDARAAGQTIRAGEPVEIRQPFANGDKVTVNVDGACAWCDDPHAPKSGYYARVQISTASKEAARLGEAQLNYDIGTATPVIVQAATRKTR